MNAQDDFTQLPPNLPEPRDDGAASHLPGMAMPAVELASTSGRLVNVGELPGRAVLFCYPMTGRPGAALPEGWDAIPGARGCTPEACGFRDRATEWERLGVTVFGVSTQSTADQREARQRLRLPFELLSDEQFKLTTALRLPTFDVAGRRLLKRLTLVVFERRIEKVFYPIFPPDRHAGEVLAYLSSAI